MALIHDNKNKPVDDFDDEKNNVFELIEQVSKAISPVIIPMIEGLAETPSLQEIVVLT